MEPSKPRIPDLQVQSLAVDFIDNHLDKYHPAFSTPHARYDPAQGSFVAVPTPRLGSPPMQSPDKQQPSAMRQRDDMTLSPRSLADPANALKFWDSLFVRAMKKFAVGPKATKEPAGRAQAGFSIRDKTSWTAIFKTLQSAQESYFRTKGIKGAARIGYRAFADHAAPLLLDVTNLVPETGCVFVTPVVGSIQIVLEAVKKAAEVRKAMEGAFDNIDISFQEIELFLQIFPDDDNIINASIELVVSTFTAVESVIGFFIQSVLKRIRGSVFKRDEYEKEVLETLSKVQSNSALLIRQADNSQMWMMHQGFKEVIRAKDPTHIKETFKPILDLKLKEYMDELAYKFEKSQRKERAAFLSIVSSFSRPNSPNPPPYDDIVEPQQYVEPQELLDWIDIPDAASDDRQYISERGCIWVPSIEQARAEQLIQSSRFRDWMVEGKSSQLLVHGNYEGQRYISGLSLFCLSFVQSLLARNPQFIPLIFFCGLHVDAPIDQHTGGRAIIQNFICQLMCLFDFDTRLLVSEKLDEHLIQQGNVNELCKLFQWLVGQLPQSTVLFCVIDGVEYYERTEFEHDMGFVVEKLLRISDEETTGAGVKILLTSPNRTHYVRQPFPDELVLSMESMPRADIVTSKSRLERQLSDSQLPVGAEALARRVSS